MQRAQTFDMHSAAETERGCEHTRGSRLSCDRALDNLDEHIAALSAKHCQELKALEQRHQEERAQLEATAAALKVECLSLQARLAEQQLQVRPLVASCLLDMRESHFPTCLIAFMCLCVMKS
jgi:hypothetical protein